MVSRAERSAFGDWWWTVDRFLLAGPRRPDDRRPRLPDGRRSAGRGAARALDVPLRQPAGALPRADACDPARRSRSCRCATCGAWRSAVYAVGMVLILLAFQFGPEIKGAHRWIMIGGIGVQPSEFVKPAFVVLAAWAFSEGARRKDMPGALLGLPAACRRRSFRSSSSPISARRCSSRSCGAACSSSPACTGSGSWASAAPGLVGIVAAYEFLPHVRARIERFMDKSSGDTFQVDTAMESFSRGGWLGRGPGEGTVKRILPDAHTDFIFAVTAEEFGIVVCIAAAHRSSPSSCCAA